MNKITLYLVIIIGIILIMNVFDSNIYYITENFKQQIVNNKINYVFFIIFVSNIFFLKSRFGF